MIEIPALRSLKTTAIHLGKRFYYKKPQRVAQERQLLKLTSCGRLFVLAMLLAVLHSSLRAETAPLGSTSIGSTSGSVSVNLTFTTAGTIVAPVVLTAGATGLEFADAGTGTCTTNGTSHPYSIGDSCTVDVTLTPQTAGLRIGAVELVNSSGSILAISYVYGTGTGPRLVFNGPLTPSSFTTAVSNPYGVAVDGAGKIYVAGYNNTVVTMFPAGCSTASCATSLGGGFSHPEGLALDGAGNLYVADYGNKLIKQIPAGCTSSTCVLTLPGTFSGPTDVAVDQSGNIYVADYTANAVKEIPAGCALSSCVTSLGGGFSTPRGVAVDANGIVYVADYGNNAVKEIPASCALSSCVLSLGSGFVQPRDVAVDGSGNLYVSNTWDYSVQQMAASCVSSSCVTTLATGFVSPRGLTVDGSGNVYVADSTGGVVKQLNRVSPPTVSFPTSTAKGTTDSTDNPQMLVVSNIGTATLTFPLPTVAGSYNPAITGDFSLAGNSTCQQTSSSSAQAATLDAGDSCTFKIDFSPTQTGSLSGTLLLTDDTLNAASPTYITQSVPLSGVGVAPSAAATLSTALSFGSQLAGTTETLVATFTNTGNVALTGISASLSGSNASSFALATGSGACGTTLDTGSSCLIYVSFTPAAAGSFSATLNVASSATGSPNVATLGGTGTADTSPVAGLTAALSFGNQVVNNSATLAATLTNTGNAVLTGISASLSGTNASSFAISTGTGACGTTLSAGASCSIYVSFTPTATGSYVAALAVADSATNSPQSTALTGTGVSAATAQSVVLGFGSQAVGSTAVARVTMTVTAGGNIAAPRVLTQGATGLEFTDAGTGSCTTNGSSYSYSANDTCVVDVAFKPSYPGLRLGTVKLVDSSNNTLATANVYGTGVGPQMVFNSPLSTVTLGGGFNYPYSLATDASGNIYVGDTMNYAIYKLGPSCKSSSCVELLANGFGSPTGVAVDGAGTIFISDYLNNAVKQLPAGCNSFSCMTTVASGFSKPQGVAVDGAGNLYVGDWGNNAVQEIPAGCTSSSCFVSLGGGFSHPYGVAVDASGNVYVADWSNNAIKQIPAGCTTSTCVVTLGGSFNQPRNVAVDGGGNVYVADVSNKAVKEIPAGCTAAAYTASQCTTTTISAFNYPYGVAVDRDGNVYATDASNGFVKQLNRTTPTVTFATATQTGSTDTTDGPQSITVTNIGNSTLTFPAPTTGSINPSLAANFSQSTASCTQPLSTTTTDCVQTSAGAATACTLAASGSCTLGVSFAPTQSGTISGSLVFMDDHLNAQSPSYAAQTVLLNGTGKPAVVATQAIAAASLVVNVAATSFTPVTGSGGTGTLTYSILPSLPTGLALNTSTGAITGTATTASSATTYTVTVTDSTSATATATFSLTVNSAVSATQVIATKSLTTGRAASFTPVTGSGGMGTLTYSISTSLPSGLAFSTSSGSITGTPTTTSSAATYTVTVTDSTSATATATFSLAVNPAVAAAQEIAAEDLTTGRTAAFTPVTGSGGTGTLAYSISPSLPTGLALNTSNGSVTGTATAWSASTNYTVTVTDTNGATATETFSLLVNPDFAITITPASQRVKQGGGAVFTVTVQVSNGTFSGTVTLGVDGLPSGATARFSSQTLSPGNSSAVSTLTIQTSTASAQTFRNWPRWWLRSTPMLAIVLLPGLFGKKRRWRKVFMAVLLAFVLTTLALSGCGGSTANNQGQSYNLQVTATSGSNSHVGAAVLTVLK